MDNFALVCRCGHAMKISVRQFGQSGTCPACKQWLTPGADNTEPLHLYEARTRTAANPNLCLKCEKPFRGDWDKVSTPEGIVCHHCSIRAVEGVPVRPSAAPPQPIEIPKPVVEIEVKKRLIPFPEIDTESPLFKRIILIAGLSVVLMTAMLLKFGDYDISRAARIEVADETAIELPTYARAVVLVWYALMGLLTPFFGIYFMLLNSNRLPHEAFARNSVHIGTVVIVQLVLSLVTYSLFSAAMGILAARVSWSILIGAPGSLIQILILMRMLDLGFLDLLKLLFYSAIVGIGLEAVSVAFYGLFYMLVT